MIFMSRVSGAGGENSTSVCSFVRYNMAPYVKEVHISYIDQDGTNQIEDISDEIGGYNDWQSGTVLTRNIKNGTALTVVVTATGGGGYGGNVWLYKGSTFDEFIGNCPIVRDATTKEEPSTYSVLVTESVLLGVNGS